jgi:hypothetical protein
MVCFLEEASFHESRKENRAGGPVVFAVAAYRRTAPRFTGPAQSIPRCLGVARRREETDAAIRSASGLVGWFFETQSSTRGSRRPRRRTGSRRLRRSSRVLDRVPGRASFLGRIRRKWLLPQRTQGKPQPPEEILSGPCRKTGLAARRFGARPATIKGTNKPEGKHQVPTPPLAEWRKAAFRLAKCEEGQNARPSSPIHV